jgi:hypothetical protein
VRKLSKVIFFFFGGTGGYSASWQVICPLSHAPILSFALVIFGIVSYIYVQASMDHSAPIYASPIAGVTVACHHTQLFIG